MKVGDYVRTKYGIAKYISDKATRVTIYKVIDKDIVYDNVDGWEDVLFDNEIIKSSPNIIDLIEVGDYVNGCRVEEHAHEKGRLFVTYTYIGGKGFTTYEDYSWELTKDTADRIESIVTKEQFESMEYKIGGISKYECKRNV